MDTLISAGPLATVKLIPLFNYLNMLSDFLFTENYLAEVNQNKQIPVLNALYEYLDVHRDDQTEKEKLIRYLLQGSDLYGEQDDENLEPIFVNAMFDYIISSLVFDKYGNIYGFLAYSICRSKKLQFDYVMKDIKEKLKSATFQNEYGANSVLTDLAVNRIYNDIILPYFPQPETNLSIFSLDYIFAQAGSTYLRLGRINDTYYSDPIIKNFQNIREPYLFEDYLIIGHTIGKLLQLEEIDPSSDKIFALPALCHYLLTEREIMNETITKVIFHPGHWEKVYHNFFKYIGNLLDQIDQQLNNDYTYQMHLALLHFQNRLSMAENIIHSKCIFLNKEDEEKVVATYLQNAKNCKCENVNILPNINVLFEMQIFKISEMYRKYERELTLKHFQELIKNDLQGVMIKLLLPNQEVFNGDFNDSQNFFYDLLEFHFTVNGTSDYYAIIRGNYTFTFLKESDNPQLFQHKLGSSLDELKRSATYAIILKLANQGINVFLDKLVNYKKEQFALYFLNKFTENLGKKKWWLEFGLALVPSYPCLFNNDDSKLCEINEMKFLNNFQKDLSLYITNKVTRTLLSDCGTTIKTLVLRYSIYEAIDTIVTTLNKSTGFPENETRLSDTCDKITSGIEDPDCSLSFVTNKETQLITRILDYLSEKIDYHFIHVNSILNKMYFLEHSFFRNVSVVGKTNKEIVYVNKYYNNNTGYGYKFIITHTYNNQINIAQLRTIYDFKDKIFISLYQNSSNLVKRYIKLNNESLEYEIDYFIYEVNYKIRRKYTRLLFSGISIFNDNNDKCDNDTYSEGLKYSSICRRYWRFVEKTQIENEAIQIVKNYFAVWKNVSEEQIHNSLKKYTLPEDKTFLVHFIKHLINDPNFEKSEWSESCIVDNYELFNKLRYEISLENNNVSIADGKRRINSIYTYRERRKIEEGTSIEYIINDYNEQKASYSSTFEDYYAIRNFATTGDTRITGNTDEAKLMKLALYKLAIRQSDDRDQEFDLKLFRVECKPLDLVNNHLYVGKHITLQKFMFTSTNVESATRFAAYPASGFRNVLYVIEFFGPYFRAKIQMKVEQFEALIEKKVVLLPGSEFIIKKISISKMGGLGNVLNVVLSSRSENTEKYGWYKNIMREIRRIEV